MWLKLKMLCSGALSGESKQSTVLKRGVLSTGVTGLSAEVYNEERLLLEVEADGVEASEELRRRSELKEGKDESTEVIDGMLVCIILKFECEMS
jgi:hypothetical protein